MKVIEDILREVDQEVLRKAPHAQRKYNKITESLRTRFLTKIFHEAKSIKKAAEELNINYSSAKTILTMYRKKEKLAPSSSKMQLEGSSSSSAASVKTLPPKNMTVNSFMSTASNLSDMKDCCFEESQEQMSSPSSDENGNKTSAGQNGSANNSSAFKKSFVQNKSFLFGSQSNLNNHNNSSNNLSALAQNSPNVQKATSIIIAPPAVAPVVLPIETAPVAPSALTPAMMLQLQQQFQAQQQQQQLQNALQQLIMLQSAMLAQNNAQPQNQFMQLLLQQQLLNNSNNNNNNNNGVAPNWI